MTPDILLLIVDDLRADRVGHLGCTRAETPCLDSLASRGLSFTRCFSTTGWTLPACASIVTGRLPSEHGLIHHEHRFGAPKIPALLGAGRYATYGVGNNGNLVPDTIPTETLDRLGFERRPEVWKHFGWQDGFETYDWFHKEDRDGPFDAFAKWFDSRGDDPRPWFAMFHTNLVHDYDADDPWYVDVERFLGRPLDERLRKFRDGPHIWRDPPEGMDHETLAEELLAKYDGGVAEFDRRLARLLERIDTSRTVVLLVSDHGEGYDGPRERVHHCGRLHDDLLRVPLLLLTPPGMGAPPAGTRIDTPCSILDVAPTLLALGGGNVEGLPGGSLLDLPAERELAAEDFGYLYAPRGDATDPLRRYEYKRYDLATRATIRWPHKRIEARIGRQSWTEEYDLELDPLERVNRAVGAQRPVRRPQREEGAIGAALRSLRTETDEAAILETASNYAAFARRVGRRRRLPPVERHRAWAQIEEREPITFVIAVDDPRELRRHVQVSACYAHGGHQWLLVENQRNRAYDSISRLYEDARARAENDLLFFVHQDVLFPPDFEDRFFRALRALEQEDPTWGVVGAAGRALPETAEAGEEPANIGHWSDPHKYHRPRVSLPAQVQVLDELWLGVRASAGLAFDPALPGFHCYGADLCMTARAAGRKSYVLDAPVIHKLLRPDGSLIERSDQSHKIAGRATGAFRAGFQRSADHVAGKWSRYLPFQSTCHRYAGPPSTA